MGNAYIPREQVHAWSEEIGKNPAAQRPRCMEILQGQPKLRLFLDENLGKMSGSGSEFASRLVDVCLLVFYVSGGSLNQVTWEAVRAVSNKVQASANALLPPDAELPQRLRQIEDRAQPHLLDEIAMILFESDCGLARGDAFRCLLIAWLTVEVLDAAWVPPMGFAGELEYKYESLDDAQPGQARLPMPMPTLPPISIAHFVPSLEEISMSTEPPEPEEHDVPDEPKAVGEVEGPAGSVTERKLDRFEKTVEVNIASEHNFYAGFTENMSSGGLFVATNLIRPIGTILEFELSLGKGTLKAKGEVRWVREPNDYTTDVPPGMGLRFIGLDPRVEKVIDDFMAGKRESIFFDDDDDD
jgi:uncharacterized protein (TIGR02266 family)